jgi:hypothetical protein
MAQSRNGCLPPSLVEKEHIRPFSLHDFTADF